MTLQKPKSVGLKGSQLAASAWQGRISANHDYALDSTIPNVNAQAQIEEKFFDPGVEDIVSAKVARHSSEGVGLTIDVSKAHKRLRIREDEWKLFLCQHRGKTLQPTQCATLGACFSDAWWSRMGRVLIRICHRFLFIQHGGWLYVDDFLFRLEATTAPLVATCICCLLHILGCPISWHKFELGRPTSKRVFRKFEEQEESPGNHPQSISPRKQN